MIARIKKLTSGNYDADALKKLNAAIYWTYKDAAKEDQSRFAQELELFLNQNKSMPVLYQIYLQSVLIAFFEREKASRHLVDCMQLIYETEEVSPETKFFSYNQFLRIEVDRPDIWLQEADRLHGKLYVQIYEAYAEQLKEYLMPIPCGERNAEFIVVFVAQFLSLRHAPTHSALERCYALGAQMGKQVLLVNTRELMTTRGRMPFYGAVLGKVKAEYSKLSKLSYKEYAFDFFQPEAVMPDLNTMRVILGLIREMKPWFVLGIGGNSILADLCSRIVPEAVVATNFSNLPRTQGQMAILGRVLTDEDTEKIASMGYVREQILESTFTFEMKPQKKVYTRQELGLPEDRFLLVTVGMRLDADITDEFVERMLETAAWGTHLVLVGGMSTYDRMCERHPAFREHATCLGYQDDVLAVLEVCDLYVNPRRLGGGFSIVESFYKSVPGVTIAYGDIATAAGKDFCAADYDEMLVAIKRYIEDKAFYQAQVEKAQARVKILLDGKAAMEKIVREIETNPGFF